MSTSPSKVPPAVSVLIPTYNRDSSLCEALEAAFSQDYPGKMEVIVVDQSTDHNEEVKRFFQHHRDDFRCIYQSKPNAPMARNTAFAAAKHELLLFLDDDIILPPDALTRLARHFDPIRPQAITALLISEKNPESSPQNYAAEHESDAGRDTVLKRVDRFLSALILLPAETFRAVGGFDSLMGDLTPTAASEDTDLCYRLRLAKIPLFIDLTLRVVHKDHLAGGCAWRWRDPRIARKYNMKSIAYMAAKYHGSVGLRGWIGLCRGYVLNRQALSRGFRYVRDCFLDARSAVSEVRSFIAVNKDRMSSHGTTQ